MDRQIGFKDLSFWLKVAALGSIIGFFYLVLMGALGAILGFLGLTVWS